MKLGESVQACKGGAVHLMCVCVSESAVEIKSSLNPFKTTMAGGECFGRVLICSAHCFSVLKKLCTLV